MWKNINIEFILICIFYNMKSFSDNYFFNKLAVTYFFELRLTVIHSLKIN